MFLSRARLILHILPEDTVDGTHLREISSCPEWVLVSGLRGRFPSLCQNQESFSVQPWSRPVKRSLSLIGRVCLAVFLNLLGWFRAWGDKNENLNFCGVVYMVSTSRRGGCFYCRAPLLYEKWFELNDYLVISFSLQHRFYPLITCHPLSKSASPA